MFEQWSDLLNIDLPLDEMTNREYLSGDEYSFGLGRNDKTDALEICTDMWIIYEIPVVGKLIQERKEKVYFWGLN